MIWFLCDEIACQESKNIADCWNCIELHLPIIINLTIKRAKTVCCDQKEDVMRRFFVLTVKMI